jgi:aryl-alcohol dehydrogenase-like predicted oxidoreductase
MRYNPLANTDLKISRICLGTINFLSYCLGSLQP